MFIQILARIIQGTPMWVFGLFLALIAYGYVLSKDRDVRPFVVGIPPIILGLLSLSRVIGTFGAEPLALLSWAAGTAAALLANRALKQPDGARWSEATGTYHVPGSWTPLALMMAVFFARYAMAVLQVMSPALIHTPAFSSAASFGFGLLSGVFVARAWWVWSRRAAQEKASMAAPLQLMRT
jgi:hypothetical protein